MIPNEFVVMSADGAETMQPGGTMGESKTVTPLVFYSPDVSYAACQALGRDDLRIHLKDLAHLETPNYAPTECPASGCRIRSRYDFPD